MVEKARRNEVGDHPRGGDGREWEVFVREDEDDPMRHVGSVSAPSPEVAHEQATRLFAWFAADVWICPADETHRFSTHDLDDEATPAPHPDEGEGRETNDRTAEGRTHEL